MAAIAKVIYSNRNVGPACLRRENPDRLVSLWGIVNQFELYRLLIGLQTISESRGRLDAMATAGQGGGTLSPAQYQNVLDQLEFVKGVLKDIEFKDSLNVISLATHRLDRPSRSDISTMAGDLLHIGQSVLFEGAKRRYLQVVPDRAKYVDNPALFGDAVKTKFPSAREDIQEAGNCLAAECSTAAVFHLMRAVEWGLRSLCAHLGFRRVRTVHKKTGRVSYISLQWCDWETILNQARSRVTQRASKLKRGNRKQLYQEFYHPALQDIEGIKDAWRNHVMHTRRAYTPLEAEAIKDRVQRLMEHLAGRISEL